MKYFETLVFITFILQIVFTQDIQHVEVLIIGAGAAGLHSAFRLTENGIKNIAILEAQERIGGRIHSVATNGDWIEHGAQWIHGQGENPLWKFIEENEIPIAPEASRAGEGIYVRDDGNEIPNRILDQTFRAFEEFLDGCDQTVSPENPESVGNYLQSEFEYWLENEKPGDFQTTRKWRRQLYKYWLKSEQFDSACDDLFNQSAVSWCSFEEFTPDTSFMNGYQSLLDVYQTSIDNNAIPLHLNTKVTKIKWQNDDGKVIVETEDGKMFAADYVIVTVSLGYLQRHHSGLFVPQLPDETAKVIETLKMGSANKIFLEFEEPFWDQKYPGYQFLYTGDATDEPVSQENWVRWIVGFDSVQNQPNMLVGWISGQPARVIEGLSDETIAEGIKMHLVTVLRLYHDDPSFELPNLTKISVTRWNSNPYTLGAYSYREIDSDQLGISHSDLANPVMHEGVPKILFAGEATTDEYFSAVHGAIASADREVDRIVEMKKEN